MQPASKTPGPRGGHLLDIVPFDTVAAAFSALRTRQWTKNALLFAALLFSFRFTDPWALLRVTLGFLAFSLVSSTGYVFNDLRDRLTDANHPRKRARPIASGRLPVRAAWVLMAMCLAAGFALALWLSPAFALVAALYFLNTMSYTLFFKHQVILDVMLIAAGFLWRAVAGAVVISVGISPWLLLCTAFLALFLGFNKRRSEIVLLRERAGGHRRNLVEYTPAMLDEFQAITTSGTVISYALYTVLGSPTPWLLLTLPHVLYGIFRYIYLVQSGGENGAPDETLLRDRPILLTCLLYAVTAAIVLLWTGAPPPGS